eukprot:scaffold2280_cov430-Prasinococcus_capsulatus_cf.AAC.9
MKASTTSKCIGSPGIGGTGVSSLCHGRRQRPLCLRETTGVVRARVASGHGSKDQTTPRRHAEETLQFVVGLHNELASMVPCHT